MRSSPRAGPTTDPYAGSISPHRHDLDRTARVSERIGSGRTLALGQLLVGGGILALSFVSADGAYLTDALPGLALVAIGSGLSYGPAHERGDHRGSARTSTASPPAS